MTEFERLERIIDESLIQAAAAEARLIEMLKDLPPHRLTPKNWEGIARVKASRRILEKLIGFPLTQSKYGFQELPW